MRVQCAEDLDGLAGQRFIIHIRVITVGRIFHNRDRLTFVAFEIVHNFLAQHGSCQRFGFVGINIFFLDGDDVHIGGFGVFIKQRGIQFRGQGIVPVDDAIVHIGQYIRNHRGFHFNEFETQRVVCDVGDGSGDAGFVINIDQAISFQQQKRTTFIGRIIRDCDGDSLGGNGSGRQDQQRSNNQNQILFHNDSILSFIQSKLNCQGL